jgi:hypothetical protein
MNILPAVILIGLHFGAAAIVSPYVLRWLALLEANLQRMYNLYMKIMAYKDMIDGKAYHTVADIKKKEFTTTHPSPLRSIVGSKLPTFNEPIDIYISGLIKEYEILYGSNKLLLLKTAMSILGIIVLNLILYFVFY